MTYIIGETATYEEKTKDLCEAILEDRKLKAAFSDIESFQTDKGAQEVYAAVAQKEQELGAKQQAGVELTAGEVEDYKKLVSAVEGNEVANGFIEAQQLMHEVQKTVNTWIGMTMELGRVPTEEDFRQSGESCGTG